jgi:amino acid adenylation domain-containing protein
MVSGGERLTSELAARLVNGAGELWNLYGPTETTIYSLSCRVEGPKVVIGRPIANTQIYLLDGRFNPAPMDAVGEIFIGGEGVARGYLGRAGLTSERFVPSPFSEGKRLYRTGDIARWRSDGTLDFLGRSDDQVKLRGFRIELGEIEAALRAAPGVQEAVALVREDRPSDKRLVAYVVRGVEPRPEADALCLHLERRLPKYMVPTAFVLLDALPLTPNGKIDRRALPRPTAAAIYHDAAGEVATQTEKTVSDIWSNVLGFEGVDRAHDFFEIGGHSLLASEISGIASRKFGVNLTPGSLFSNPTVAAWSSYIDNAIANHEPIRRLIQYSAEQERAPASIQQQRLWFLQRLSPESASYNVPAAVRFQGAVNADAMMWAMDQLVQRHEVLRTHISLIESGAIQDVVSSPEKVASLVDLSDLAEDRRENEWRHRAAALACRPFMLEKEIPFRVVLFRLDQLEHVLVAVLHHSATDAWSLGILLRDLSKLYAARLGGVAHNLECQSLTYGDYARWQQHCLKSGEFAGSIDRWRQYLVDAPSTVEIPTDFPRSEVGLHRGEYIVLPLGIEQTRRLSAASRSASVTPFVVLTAAFALVLSRYAVQDDIVLGTIIANRHHTEISQVAGLVANTLPIRIDLTGDPSFADLVQRVQRASVILHSEPDVPFDRLVQAVRPDRSANNNPIFQILISHQPDLLADCEFPSVKANYERLHSGAAKFDLSLQVEQNGSDWDLVFEYDATLFKKETVEGVADHMRGILLAGCDGLDKPITGLTLPTEADRTSLIEAQQIAITNYCGERFVQNMFDFWAKSTPENTALRYEGHSISYGVLQEQSRAVEGYLLVHGVISADIVVMLIEDGPLQIAAMLGIAAAGAVFAALDTTMPMQRLQLIMEELQPRYVLADQDLIDQVEWAAMFKGTTATVVSMSSILNGPASSKGDIVFSKSIAAGAKGPQAPVYIVYTSGSTGRPKGIVQSHIGLAQFVDWQASAFNLGPGKNVAQWAPISYDAAYTEIFTALCSGATLCMLRRERRGDPEAVVEWLGTERISFIQLVPSFFRHVLHELIKNHADIGSHPLPHLETVWLAGEVLAPDLASEWLRAFPERPELFNLYGPTETILATYHRVDQQSADLRTIPVGRAIPGRQILVFDALQKLCPLDIPGEIYIRSPYLTLGYFQRPEETAACFVQNPLTLGRADPVYRTGDVGRLRADGTLEFVGRNDHQIKIRGNRVELTEIEAVFSRLEGVRECAVVPIKRGGETTLAAYLVGERPWSVDELRQHAMNWLPAYMVPGSYSWLGKLPRTGTNKIDRRGLPFPVPGLADPAPESLGSKTPTQAVIARIWMDLLEKSTINLDENFFDVGGHSLLAVRVQERIRIELGKPLRLVEVFKYPTIRSLSEFIVGGVGSKGSDIGERRAERRQAALRSRSALRE